MPANPPDNMPRITPNVFYDDPAAAIEWLGKAFGLGLRMSIPGEDGGVMHAELELGGGVIMLSPTASNEKFTSPTATQGACTQSLYVYVDDVDAHCAQARSAGATIVDELDDMFWGDRTYVALDNEGHRWAFAQHTRDVSPDEMSPPGA